MGRNKWTFQAGAIFDTLYHVLKATKAERVTELSEGWLKNAVVILRSFQNIDEQSRQHVFQMLSLLLAAAKDNFSIMLPQFPLLRLSSSIARRTIGALPLKNRNAHNDK